MMQKENKILELGFQDSIIYKQSANTLFNFMRDIDFLVLLQSFKSTIK